jgi:hypothetical protein
MNVYKWINNKTVQWFLGTITVPVILFACSRWGSIDALKEKKERNSYSAITVKSDSKAVR